MFCYLIKVLEATGVLLISDNFIHIGKISNRNSLLQMFMLDYLQFSGCWCQLDPWQNDLILLPICWFFPCCIPGWKWRNSSHCPVVLGRTAQWTLELVNVSVECGQGFGNTFCKGSWEWNQWFHGWGHQDKNVSQLLMVCVSFWANQVKPSKCESLDW